jgi:hypothetical protein
MQIRYAARDAPAHGAFLEAAVDDVRIIATFKVDGDLDGDGDVDLADFSRFLACMGADLGGGCQSADIDGSGEVDLADFAQFFAALEGPG